MRAHKAAEPQPRRTTAEVTPRSASESATSRRGVVDLLRRRVDASYVVMAGRLVTNLGFFMVVPFITVFVVEHEHMTGTEAGLLFSILLFTRRGFGLPAGWASDRFGPANTLSSGLSLEAVAYLTFAFAGTSFVSWSAAAALLGAGGALNNNGDSQSDLWRGSVSERHQAGPLLRVCERRRGGRSAPWDSAARLR
jgi:MFS family permease